MGFLRLLEGLRHPVADAVFSAVTVLGEETCFMALALLVFWCVSKRRGYYLFAVGFFGVTLNQFLKLWFRVPRPWIRDPGFTIVESARAAAAGYSFPSGHTQNAVGTLGALGLSSRRTWLRVVCGVTALLVPLSRLYLGVHTPLDVGVSFLAALVLVLVLWPFFRSEVSFRTSLPWVLAVLALLAALYAAFVLLYPFGADLDAENYAAGAKNAWVLIGCALGLPVCYVYDQRVLRFDTRAPLPGQALKLTLGLALAVALRIVLKAPLLSLLGGHMAAHSVRYFLLVVFAGCVWPHTFPLFARVGGKKFRKTS